MKSKKGWISLTSSVPIAKMFVTRYSLLLICIILSGCHPASYVMEPNICYSPSQCKFESSPSAFEPLTPDEKKQEWGKELFIGRNFGRELDLYRSITAFKRAGFLIPQDQKERKLQIDYSIVKNYYIGRKYCDAIAIFESSALPYVTSSFPAFPELTIMLEDAYYETNQTDKAEGILELITKGSPETADRIILSHALKEADLCQIYELAPNYDFSDEIYSMLDCYHCNALSVRKAQFLNAILPGAGYYYVGQTRSAITSFVINVLTTATAYYFYTNDNIPAGILATSVELGWYIGGINGAGLAAKQYNEALYETCTKDFMIKHNLFPLLRLETSF